MESFPLRGPIGNHWSRCLKASADLAKDYAAVGRSYTAQRDFRREWAKKEFNAEVSRKFVETSTEFEGVNGSYMSLSQICWEEKNKVAACNWVMSAIKDYREGRLFGDKPWCSHNHRTKQMEFWYIKKEYRTGQLSSWSTVHKEVRTHAHAKAAPSASVAEARPSAPEPVPSPEKLKLDKGKKDKDPKEEERRKKEKKDMEAGFSKFKVLRVRFDAALSLSNQIVVHIASDPLWLWAKHETEPLKALRSQLDECRNLSSFWREWGMAEQVSDLRKKKARRR